LPAEGCVKSEAENPPLLAAWNSVPLTSPIRIRTSAWASVSAMSRCSLAFASSKTTS